MSEHIIIVNSNKIDSERLAVKLNEKGINSSVVVNHEEALGRALEHNGDTTIIMPNEGKLPENLHPHWKLLSKGGSETGAVIRDILEWEKNGNIHTIIIGDKETIKIAKPVSDVHRFLGGDTYENIIKILKGESIAERFLIVR